MALGQGVQFLLIVGELRLQSGKLLNQLPKHLLAQGSELVLFGLKLTDHGLTKLRHPFGDHDPILVQQPVHFMHQGRPLAHAMEGLDVLLVDVLDRHKTHSGPRHRFRDALGIAAVVFVRLDIRLHELGCHALHLVAMLAEASHPVMRTATGFYADAYRGQLRQKGHQVMPGQALAQDDLASLIHSHRVKHALCNVDPEYAHLWFHWTRLLWLHGCTDLALIVAHRSRSAQGRVHFITTKQGKFEGLVRGPYGIAWEPDSPLYRAYASDSSWNTGHVHDPTITAMLKEQRRTKDLAARKQRLFDIQQYAAEQRYYVYTSAVMITGSWQPYVKNYAPNMTFDYGSRAAALWLER